MSFVGTTAHLLSSLALCATPRHQDLGESAPGPRAGLVKLHIINVDQDEE